MEDIKVQYDTKIEELRIDTNFDFPDGDLEVEILTPPNPDEESVIGSFSKRKDKFAEIQVQFEWDEEDHPRTLYEKLVPELLFKDYLNVPIDNNIMEDLIAKLQEVDHRYGIMLETVKTQKDLLQWLVNFRWRRFNLLDNYIPFTMYIDLVTSILSIIRIPTDFPVLITGNTILKKLPDRSSESPFYIDYKNGTIVHTSEEYVATMETDSYTKSEKSLNRLNLSFNWSGEDWLVTNNKNWLTLTSNTSVKKINVKYHIDAVTGIHYVDNYVIIYVITNYTEHAIIIDKDFNIVEDSVTVMFNNDIIKLMDPKTLIFRDKYQYYVNNEDGTFATFPLVDMLDINNRIVKKYTILQTTLKDPRPISIVDNGPRINTKYNEQYQMIWSYNDSISLMTLYPAMGYEFDKYSFYNPRKYLKDSDYNEACIPMHGGFRRTRIYPYFWGRPGFTWVDGHYFRRSYSYWNMFWWFYW